MAWVAWHQRRFAPETGQVLIADVDLVEGMVKAFEFGEGKRPFSMMVLRKAGQVRGWINACPHFQLPLNAQPDRFLNKDGTKLTCVHHYARFDPLTGECIEGPCLGDQLLPVDLELIDGNWCVGVSTD